jgi:hypothetical protein
MQAAYLELVAAVPDVEARLVGDGVAVRTGVPSNAENGVVRTALGDTDVAEVAAWLRAVPAKWLVGSGAGAGRSRRASRRCRCAA